MKRAGLKNQIGIFSLKWENILNLDVNGSQLNTNFPKLKGLQKVYNIMCIKIIQCFVLKRLKTARKGSWKSYQLDHNDCQICFRTTLLNFSLIYKTKEVQSCL